MHSIKEENVFITEVLYLDIQSHTAEKLHSICTSVILIIGLYVIFYILRNVFESFYR